MIASAIARSGPLRFGEPALLGGDAGLGEQAEDRFRAASRRVSAACSGAPASS